MGQSLFPYVSSLLFDPVTWLPRQLIARALVYQYLLKVLICGFLFFRFLELRALNFRASLLGALLLSFSAYMCMGSCWTSIGNEVVCLVFVLFAIENALARGRWIYLPFAVACCGLLTPFHLYFCALLLSIYAPARLFEMGEWKWRPNMRICALLAAAAFLGVGLAAVVWLDGLSTILNSPRGSGLNSYANKLFSFRFFALEAPRHYLTAILRPFSNDMAGNGSNFRGWQNYLEAPSSYCGLLCLLMVPQVFVGVPKRQKILCELLLLLMIIPVMFPWFRYLFWLFQGDYYRTFSLFSIFALITLSMTAFFRYSTNGTLNPELLAMTLFVLIGILYLPIQGIDFGLRKTAVLLLVAYAVLLAAGRYFKRESICSWLIIGLCGLELCYFDRVTVAGPNRSSVTKQEMKERVGYNDYTIDALRELRTTDRSFYRITKLYRSSPAGNVGINDALVFGYYGTMSYSSFNNLNYIKFLIAVDVISTGATETETRWAYGLFGRSVLSTFACEKYVLTRDPVPLQTDPGYEILARHGKIYVFRNKFFLPLGLLYRNYVPESVFLGLSGPAKERVLLQTAVLPDNEDQENGLSRMSSAALQESIQGFSRPDVVSTRRNTALRISSFTQNRIAGTVQCETSGVLVFQTAFDRGWRAFVDGVRTLTVRADVGLLGVKLQPGEHTVEIRYVPPFLRLGAAITTLSMLLIGFSFWRWPLISIPAKSEIPPAS
jgi:hypothetical protein